MTSSEVFTGAFEAEFAASGDTTALMRAAYIAGLSYGADANLHIARIALSPLVEPRLGLLTMSLLNYPALSRDGHTFEINDKIRGVLTLDSALSEIAAAAEADLAAGKHTDNPWHSRVEPRDDKTHAILSTLRPLAVDELKRRCAPAPTPAVETPASDTRRVTLGIQP